MMKIKSLLSSNIFKFSSVLAFNQGLNFLLIFIYLKIIDSAVYGTIGLLQSYSILIGVVAMLGVRDGFYTLYYKVDKTVLYGNFFLFFISVFSIVFFIAVVFKHTLITYFSIPIEFYSLIFIYALSNAIYANLEIILRLESWNNLYVYISYVRGLSVFMFKLYFVRHIENSSDFVSNILFTDIFSYLIIGSIVFIMVNIKILKFKYKVDLSLYPRLFKVSIPFLASNGSGWIFNGFDRVLIERFFSLEVLGIYMYGTRIAAALGSIIHQILNLLYGPQSLKLLSEFKNEEMEFLGQRVIYMLKWLILAGYVLTAIVYIALEYFSISSYEMIALFFLGAYMVEITRIIPRINGQKLLYLEKSNILSSLYIIGSIMIVLLYSQLMTFFGLGIIFLSETLVYFLITYYMHKYILENTGFTIVRINILFWFFVFGTSIYLLLYFLSSYTPKAIV